MKGGEQKGKGQEAGEPRCYRGVCCSFQKFLEARALLQGFLGHSSGGEGEAGGCGDWLSSMVV